MLLKIPSTLFAFALASIIISAHPCLANDPPLFEEHSITRSKETGTSLNIRFTSEARCMVGDLDIIERELEHSKGATLLLTIESLAGGKKSFVPVVQPITLAQLHSGYEVNLKIPATKDETSQVGIYICKDKSGSKSCADKKLADANELFKFYNKAESANHQATDKIYFFQYVTLGKDSLSFFSKSKLDDQDLSAFRQKNLSTKEWGSSAKDLELKTDYILNTQKSMASKALQMKDNKLVINLPHIDRSLCR